jgi:D-alanine transaminase
MHLADLPCHPCYLNGDYTPLNEAKVSVLDRGFIFGDGVYEVVPVYAGRAFRFAQHMARLERSLAELRIANPLSREAWLNIATQLIAKNPINACGGNQNNSPNDYLIYYQITRGVALRDHAMPPQMTPTVFAMCNPLKPAATSVRAIGVACVTAQDFRWEKAHIKSTSLLGAVMSRQISFDAGAVETVMFRGDNLSEASSSNVWIVKDNVVVGPPNDHLVLEGIRYGLIQELCHSEGLRFELRRISREEVLTCDELLLSSATKEVLPVCTLDGRPVGAGTPGPVYRQLYAAYQAAKTAATI